MFKKSLHISFVLLSMMILSSCVRFHGGLSAIESTSVLPKVFPDNYEKALFKTNIKFWKKEFSGLMFFKKNSTNAENRIVFMSEVGLKFFDFKLDKNGQFSIEYILDELNRPSLIAVLEKDIKLILQKGFEEDKVKYFENRNHDIYTQRVKSKAKRIYYFYDKLNNRVNRIEYTGPIFRKIKMDVKNNGMSFPKSIAIKHYGLHLQINLRLIE